MMKTLYAAMLGCVGLLFLAFPSTWSDALIMFIVATSSILWAVFGSAERQDVAALRHAVKDRIRAGNYALLDREDHVHISLSSRRILGFPVYVAYRASADEALPFDEDPGSAHPVVMESFRLTPILTEVVHRLDGYNVRFLPDGEPVILDPEKTRRADLRDALRNIATGPHTLFALPDEVAHLAAQIARAEPNELEETP
jgi:hypothetical protein